MPRAHAAVALATLALTAAAGADTVEMRFVEPGLTREVQISGVANITVLAGELVHEFRNGTGSAAALQGVIRTFCTEVTQEVTPDWHLYDLVHPSSAPNPGAPMGPDKALQLSRLYEVAGGQQHGDADFAAAFQMLVWEIVYDYDASMPATGNLDRTAGAIQFLSGDAHFGSVSAIFDALRADILATGGPGITALQAVVNDGHQDQLVLIPLPSAGAMGLAGLGLLAARRRR